MKVNVHFVPAEFDEDLFIGKTAVVIDVLRATSTMVTALVNGAQEIIPVASPEQAFEMFRLHQANETLLAGEQYTKRVEGFHLGNSPLEFTASAVKSKRIVHYTTNGTVTLTKTKKAEHSFVCAFLNINAVAERIIENGLDCEIICSGTDGNFSLEDSVCAGVLASRIRVLDECVALSDSAKSAMIIAENYSFSIEEMMRESLHGKRLVENGFGGDIRYCSQVNLASIVPEYRAGSVKLVNTFAFQDGN